MPAWFLLFVLTTSIAGRALRAPPEPQTAHAAAAKDRTQVDRNTGANVPRFHVWNVCVPTSHNTAAQTRPPACLQTRALPRGCWEGAYEIEARNGLAWSRDLNGLPEAGFASEGGV